MPFSLQLHYQRRERFVFPQQLQHRAISYPDCHTGRVFLCCHILRAKGGRTATRPANPLHHSCSPASRNLSHVPFQRSSSTVFISSGQMLLHDANVGRRLLCHKVLLCPDTPSKQNTTPTDPDSRPSASKSNTDADMDQFHWGGS